MLEVLKNHKKSIIFGLISTILIYAVVSSFFVTYKKTTKELLETKEKLQTQERELFETKQKNLELQETIKKKTVVIKEIRVDGSSTETTTTEELTERFEKIREEEARKSSEKIASLERELKFAKETKEVRRDKKVTIFGGYDPFQKSWMVGGTYDILGPIGIGMTYGSGFFGPSLSIKF